MSETVTTPAPETPAEFLEGVAATAPSQAAEVVAEATDDPPADPAPKPDKIERRVANLTRKMGEAERAREAAERRAEAAEALVRARDPDATTPNTPADIETRAAALVAEREFNKRMNEIDQSGRTTLGADQWDQAKSTMISMGAVRNQAFLAVLAESDNAAKIFADLADDTDALEDLLGRSPTAIAVRVAKMDAKLSTPAARAISNAPAPAPKIKPSGVVATPDPHNYPKNMSMKEWNAMMDAHLPRSLGGKKANG